MLITLSGTMVISCLVNIVQGGGGEVLPRFGMLENSPKTVKCVITFETDCSAQSVYKIYSVLKLFEIAVCSAHFGFFEITTPVMRIMLTMANIV